MEVPVVFSGHARRLPRVEFFNTIHRGVLAPFLAFFRGQNKQEQCLSGLEALVRKYAFQTLLSCSVEKLNFPRTSKPQTSASATFLPAIVWIASMVRGASAQFFGKINRFHLYNG